MIGNGCVCKLTRSSSEINRSNSKITSLSSLIHFTDDQIDRHFSVQQKYTWPGGGGQELLVMTKYTCCTQLWIAGQIKDKQSAILNQHSVDNQISHYRYCSTEYPWLCGPTCTYLYKQLNQKLLNCIKFLWSADVILPNKCHLSVYCKTQPFHPEGWHINVHLSCSLTAFVSNKRSVLLYCVPLTTTPLENKLTGPSAW